MTIFQESVEMWKRICVVLFVALCVTGPAFAGDGWIKPTEEELAMKTLPGYPGVPAMVLFREQITKDDLHVVLHYDRIKILTEKGKDYANVELNFVSSQGDGYMSGDDKSVGDITGRTIHTDGKIIPFTGKPYLKMIEKGTNYKYQARVFTLPDVEVGSIIEYRYATRYNDNVYESPDWYIQGELFLRAAHFAWYPTSHEMMNEDQMMVTSISWFPILPEGVTLKMNESPQRMYEVNVKDVPPSPDAEYMPPLTSFTYRVLFNFTPYRTGAEYWKDQGKRWSKKANSFIGPDGDLRSATQTIIAGATTPSEKLHKIYSAVMALENTDYTRDRGVKEDKAAGLGKVNSAGDVLKHGRGDSRQLTYLFIGMARAAGLKSYAMIVPNRSRTIFAASWLNMWQQFSNTLAIVNVDGKDEYFDPGDRFTPYGKLQWEYTYAQGVRQTDDGTDFGQTPYLSYKDTKTARVANLKMAEDGTVTGNIHMTYEGATALRWRQRALTGDDASLRKGLQDSLENMLPKTLEVTFTSIQNLKEYESPLEVLFNVKGTIGTATGKRLVLPVDLFVANERVTFPQEKRDMAVYFHYPETIQDALRINLPPTMTVEAVPTAGKFGMPGLAAYTLTPASEATNVTVRRAFLFGGIIVPVTDYKELRTFYSQFQAKDQESIVLKVAPAGGSAAKGGN